MLGGLRQGLCAGADLNWMKRMADTATSKTKRRRHGSGHHAETLHRVSKPTIARVHGAAFAGGMAPRPLAMWWWQNPRPNFGPGSAHRIDSIDYFTYVIEALGVQASKRYMLTAERISLRSPSTGVCAGLVRRGLHRRRRRADLAGLGRRGASRRWIRTGRLDQYSRQPLAE